MAPILWSNLPYLLKGAVITLWLSLIVVTLGTLLGAVLGVVATSAAPFARRMIEAYIFVLRGIPVLVVMLIGYYTFPALGFRVNAYVAVARAQIIYISAFVAEIVRSAIQSVPQGQVAAARSLGMRRADPRQVILPQATRIAIAPLLNNSLTAIKQTSYVSVVGVWAHLCCARGRGTHACLVPDLSRRNGDLFRHLLPAVAARPLERGTLPGCPLSLRWRAHVYDRGKGSTQVVRPSRCAQGHHILRRQR